MASRGGGWSRCGARKAVPTGITRWWLLTPERRFPFGWQRKRLVYSGESRATGTPGSSLLHRCAAGYAALSRQCRIRGMTTISPRDEHSVSCARSDHITANDKC